MENIKVLFVSADSGGCGFYRCFMPSYFLVQQKLCDSRISGKAGDVEKKHIDWADVIVFQRICNPKNAAWEYATIAGKRIIAENDDLYEKVPAGSPAKRFFPNHVLRGLHSSMAMADMITVTTDYLAKEYSRFGVPVHVIPNALDPIVDHWYPDLLKTNGKIILGYSGSGTHSVDFAAAMSAIDDIMQKYPFVNINALGYFPEKLMDKYPNRINVRGWQRLHNYFNAIRQLNAHIGIASIDDVEFNHAKSNLKCIEYATIRTPWIASQVGPYIDITRKSGGGLLVKNKYNAWYRALEKMINMPHNERQAMGEKARAYMTENYNIKKIVHKWNDAIVETMKRPPNHKRLKLFKMATKSNNEKFQFNQVV